MIFGLHERKLKEWGFKIPFNEVFVNLHMFNVVMLDKIVSNNNSHLVIKGTLPF